MTRRNEVKTENSRNQREGREEEKIWRKEVMERDAKKEKKKLREERMREEDGKQDKICEGKEI